MFRRFPAYGLVLMLSVMVFPSLLAGCGKKTRPVPPGAVLPAPIADLRYRLDEKGALLSWTTPTRTVRGAKLPYRIESFELFRAVVPAKDYCEGCPVPYGPAVEIEPNGDSRQMTYREPLLRPGHRYIYRVRSRAGWFLVSAESNTVSFLWDTPLQAPAGLRITPGDRELTLAWQAPRGLLDGSAPTGVIRYQVYRSLAGEDFVPLGGPVAATTFVDRQVENGGHYFYKVRAVRLYEGTEAGGMASAVVSGMPRDMVPPVPPRRVLAVKTDRGIKVVWETVLEEDLAGFRIYRRLASMSRPVLIGEVDAGRLMFIDAAPPEKGPWFYAVTAVDRAEPPNESAFSLETVFGAGD